jgi:hypothetical protein
MPGLFSDLEALPPQTWTLCRTPHGRDLFCFQGDRTLAYFFRPVIPSTINLPQKSATAYQCINSGNLQTVKAVYRLSFVA